MQRYRVRRQFAKLGEGALEMPVGQAMTRAVITVYAATPIDEALQTMTDRRIRHLPVVQHERLVGVISIGDLVKAVIEDQQVELDQLQRYIAS